MTKRPGSVGLDANSASLPFERLRAATLHGRELAAAGLPGDVHYSATMGTTRYQRGCRCATCREVRLESDRARRAAGGTQQMNALYPHGTLERARWCSCCECIDLRRDAERAKSSPTQTQKFGSSNTDSNPTTPEVHRVTIVA